METFERTIRDAVSTLKELHETAQRGCDLTDTEQPTSCYEHWERIAALHAKLEASNSLLKVREKALESMKSLTEPGSLVKPDDLTKHEVDMIAPLRYGTDIVPFSTARYLSLSSYLAATWSLYDRLTVICEKIIGPQSVADIPCEKRAPKLESAFFDVKEGMKDVDNRPLPRGFSLDCVIREKWRWPVFCSYRFRNLVLHDGIGVTDNSFFETEEPIRGFQLTQTCRKDIVSLFFSSTSSGQKKAVTDDDIHEKFPNPDLRIVLTRCNEEIDALFERLLLWGTNAFKFQVQTFSEPDKGRLSF